MKKYIILFVICFSILIPNLKANATENKQAVSSQLPFKVLSADEMVSEMGTGWNLGNTMDGHTGFTPNETLWQNVETTQEFIKVLHDTGFNNIRIPITWRSEERRVGKECRL